MFFYASITNHCLIRMLKKAHCPVFFCNYRTITIHVVTLFVYTFYAIADFTSPPDMSNGRSFALKAHLRSLT